MIKSFKARNFQSFGEWVEVDLTAGASVRNLNSYIETESKLNTSIVTAILGANGAGKSTLLKIPAFLLWFMRNSLMHIDPLQGQIPVMTHVANPGNPVEFEMSFYSKGNLFKYALHVTGERVLLESLSMKATRFVSIFVRTYESKTDSYTFQINRTYLQKFPTDNIRPNASLISHAIQYGNKFFQDLDEHFLIRHATNVQFIEQMNLSQNLLEAMHFYTQVGKTEYIEKMNMLLKRWDFGLEKIEILKKQENTNGVNNLSWTANGVHLRDGELFPIQLSLESNGTRTALVMLRRLLVVLEIGGMAIIDELEAGMHPLVFRDIIEIFKSKSWNPKRAQLIFTTHSTEALKLLDKNQIWFVEKDQRMESSAYSLSAIEGVRKDENYVSNYLLGQYGSIPQI